MQVTSLLSRNDAGSTPSDHAGVGPVPRLHQTLIGFIFIANAYVVDWFFARGGSVSGVSAFIGALLLASPILLTSARDLMRGQVSINELVSLAVLASFATGDYKTAGVVSFFMLLGEVIETRTAAGARASIESLIQLTPTRARRLTVSGEEEVNTSALRVQDVVRVRPGDTIPADGVILLGGSSINQASITGESLPVDRRVGEEVFAGTINLTGVLEIQVSRAGGDTTLGRVRELILAAEQSKLPIMRLMDQYMGYYTPLVLALGALVWVFTHQLERVIAVLVVACPCAFVLATPSAMVAALSAAARLGILIKNIADLELAARLNAFVFDKTGTLTTGRLSVARLSPVAGTTPSELLQLAASAEKYSNHPVARALQTLAGDAGVPLPEPEDFSETAGRGVRARVKGSTLLVGRAQWLREQGVGEISLSQVDLDESEGYSLLFVARDGVGIGWIGFQDQRRAEAGEAITGLHSAGVQRIAMVTGDRRSVAERVAREVGCNEVVADCLPQDKVRHVKHLKEKGYLVAVVGDGVNDAPALASGDIGIAMGAAGSEVAIHSATIALMNNDLRRLPFLVTLSRQTRRVIHQNFVIGVFFILGGLSLATLGFLNPIVAAILHNAGSLLVVFNSARLVREGEEIEPTAAPGPTATPATWNPKPA